MKIKELKNIINQFDDECDVTIVDCDQNNCYEIIEFRTCDDNSSEFKNTYVDIVINL